IRFTEGKIVIADLDFKESIQSILDSLALYSHQSIEMFMSNQMEICDLQFKADSLTDNYYEMRDRISGLSDSIKFLDYESRLNCWVLYDSIAVLNLKIDALSDRLLGMSDSVKLLAYKMYEDVYESINRDEYLIQQIDTLFNRSQKDHNYEEWSGVKSFYIYDDWGNKEYNYNWDGRYDNDWW
ncbi:MAG: hypothetical protein J6Y51_02775, partial [Bacteroidaceae bacterium]|nr:hypothetical protein [Bacteroidaceae bacterium]